MNAKLLFKIGKTVVEIVGVVTPLAAKYFKDKELDEKIEKKAAEAVIKFMENK